VKHYAKKREIFEAAQWTGAMTPVVQSLVEGRSVKATVDDQQQLQLGSGWFARVGDWICWSPSDAHGTVVSDEAFRRAYEEVDEPSAEGEGAVEAGPPRSPTPDEHELAGREFVQKLDDLLTMGLRLSRVDYAGVFRDRDELVRALRRLLEDHAYVARQRETARIRDKIKKDLWS